MSSGIQDASEAAFAEDLSAIAHIDAIPTILDVICRTTGMGFAAVARVTEARWIACAVRDDIGFGLKPGEELPVQTTICDQIRRDDHFVVIDHVAEDEIFRSHATPVMYGFQSYISVPIRMPDGRFFGTLCAIDPRPAVINTPAIVGMFRLFADLIAYHLDAQKRLQVSETALLNERKSAELREQFIAVLGHDLRNPLASIASGAELLLKLPMNEQGKRIAGLVQKSADRMAGLIDDVLDFARGRLGDGMSVVCTVQKDVGSTLEQIIAELALAWPARDIRSELSFRQPVVCDSARIGQLLSNILANALTHGDPANPVWVRGHCDGVRFELSVANSGQPIPPDTMSRLFQPFSRASERSGQQGLGLGLYIASEIARAHGGSLDVASSPEETRFTFRMPASPGP